MSRVFVADEVRLARKVVVKVLSPDLAQGISVERFEREIKTVAGLQQANIVPVLTAGDTDGLPYYTMPYVDGESLRVRLGRGPLAISEVIGVLRDVSKALAYAHRNGVVHRDIKPDNVLLSEGTAVVTDFGIAKAISAARTSSGAATLTQIGTSIGTPAYMAPEQAAGDPDIDHRADIYSVGAMAYELLSGRPVFADRTAPRMLAAHMGEVPRPISEWRTDVPPPLAELVMRCLAKEPGDRPQAATDIVRVLETITSGSGMPAMPAALLGGPGMFKRALAVYAGAFVAVAVLAKAAIVGIGLPDWVFPGSLVVMALGLPVVLWTGYVQRVARRAATATPTFTPGGTPSLIQGTMATMALKAAPHVSWYRTARGGAFAVGTFVVLIAAFMAMRAFGIGPAGSLLASGKLSNQEPLLITDFGVTNADSALGRVVSDAVRAGLSQSSVINLLSPAVMANVLRLMEKPPLVRVDLPLARQLAARVGAKAIVDGAVTGVGGGYIVVLRLVTADSGAELWSARETGDGPRGLIEATDKLTRSLRGKVGESLRAVHASEPLAEVTTASLEALREYSEGARYHDVLGDWPNAVKHFEAAVAIDSGFAMAWRKLGAALSNGARPTSEVDFALEQAHRHRERLTERERNFEEGYYYSSGPGSDRAKGMALYEVALRQGLSVGATNLGLQYMHKRDYVRAESLFVSGTRTDPGSALAWYHLAWARANQGRWPDAAATYAEAVKRFPDASPAQYHKVYNLYHAGLTDSLRRWLDGQRVSARADLRGAASWYAANLALVQGRVRTALTLYAEGAAADAAAKGTRANVPADTASALLAELASYGAPPRGAERMDAMLAKVPLRSLAAADRPYFKVATAYARMGRADRAKAMLAEYDRDVRDTTRRRADTPYLQGALAEIALAENRPSDAVIAFRRADSLPDGPTNSCGVCTSVNLARAFDAARQGDSAIVHYERFLTTPMFNRLDAVPFVEFSDPIDPLYLPGVRRRLGELYEAKGDVRRAAEQYQAFVELWKNADQELQPRVAEVKRRLARLAQVEGAKR